MKFFKKLFSQKKEKEILLEERSPSCPITAIVEQDDRVAYFYLWGDQNTNFETKACWIRNLKEAPETVEKDSTPPMMPKQFCKFPAGQNPLKKNNLNITWTEEGDSAALLIDNEIVAIIPSWSGVNGFPGYARDCIEQGNFAWKISSENIFPQRIAKAKAYWDSWDNEPNPFQILQPIILEKYEEIFGKSEQYYAIDGQEWPPRGLYLRSGKEKIIFATVCLSLLPQPNLEHLYEFPNEKNRIELGLILNNQFAQNQLNEFARDISGIANIPWSNITHLGDGHTANFDFSPNKTFTSVILTNQLDILPKVKFDEYRNSTIKLLWMIPISEKERNYVRENGSEELINDLNKIGAEIYNLNRDELR